MTETYTFTPNLRVIDRFPGCVSIADLEAERPIYSATPAFIREHGGTITNGILDRVPSSFFVKAQQSSLYTIIEARIHRLYPGEFPAVPGWHCDGDYREDYYAQPDRFRTSTHQHITTTVSTHSGGVCNTQFLAEPITATVDSPTPEHTFWGQIHTQVEAVRPRQTYDTRDGEMACFDSWTLHRAMPARIRGWRLFFRISMYHKPGLGEGMISKQEQVYRLAEGNGW